MSIVRVLPQKIKTPVSSQRQTIGKRREAARRVGYPGKGIYSHISAAEKADAMIAAARPEFGCLEGDGILCAGIAEMKVDNDRLKKTAFLLNTYYNMGG